MSVHYEPKPPVAADDPAYIAAARDEAEFWASTTIHIGEMLLRAPDGPMKRHFNRLLTGDPSTSWYEAIPPQGAFTRGLVLGSGAIIAEEHLFGAIPGLHLTFIDIDESGLERRRASWSRYAGRFEMRTADLNFADLGDASYDLIVSASTMHHIVNLEHVASQINRALTPTGRFFVYDFVGATGFRFPDAQKRVFEEVYNRERARRRPFVMPDPNWHDVDQGTFSPFEAVRSSDTLDVFRAHLDEIEVRGAGAVIGLLMFAGIGDDWVGPPPPRSFRKRLRDLLARRRHDAGLVWSRMLSEKCFEELALLDETCTLSGAFRPNSAFGVYGKRA